MDHITTATGHSGGVPEMNGRARQVVSVGSGLPKQCGATVGVADQCPGWHRSLRGAPT